jgi:uncharacterized protein YwgA
MEQKQLILKLFLDSLGCDFSISGVGDRKTLQKAVYLGQLTGVDLGYRFGWYVKGPYSSELADTYYDLDRKLKGSPEEFANKRLSEPIRTALNRLVPMFETIPNGLDKEGWLELLASYHHLRTVQSKNNQEAVKVLQAQKPHLVKYVEKAHQVLQQYNLLGA